MADPKAATAIVKERDGLVNAELEERRLRLAIDSAIATPDARAEGFGAVAGPRLALMASQVADAYATKSRINPDAVWNGSFLPAKAELNDPARTEEVKVLMTAFVDFRPGLAGLQRRSAGQAASSPSRTST